MFSNPYLQAYVNFLAGYASHDYFLAFSVEVHKEDKHLPVFFYSNLSYV